MVIIKTKFFNILSNKMVKCVLKRFTMIHYGREKSVLFNDIDKGSMRCLEFKLI